MTNKKLLFPELARDPILFGHDQTEGIVAIEEGPRGKIALWRRVGNRLRYEEEDYWPFLLIREENLLEGFSAPRKVVPLEGKGFFCFKVKVPTKKDLEALKKHLQKTSGLTPSAPGAPYYYQKDIPHLYMLESGRTLFYGLSPDEVITMAVDIETFCHPNYEFPNPDRPADRIISIAAVDNKGFEEVIDGRGHQEKAMLERLSEIISARDPDVILGHNIFKFDLSYLAARARLNRIPLTWGRDGNPLKMRRSRVAIAERIFDYPRWHIHGRHVVDTYLLTLFYDISFRELETYTLKDVARALGLATEDRTYLEGEKMNWYFENSPELLAKYNLEDARETLALGKTLGSSYFIESQIFPYPYQDVIVRGTATKINSLLLREYLHRGAAIPAPPGQAGELAGGYTRLFRRGVLKEVYHCDVKSLYPSLILAGGLKPRQDRLGVFLHLLRLLTGFRLKAKELAAGADDERSSSYLDALQKTFKILINSFYGHLASGLHHFSDPKTAAVITETGRRTIKKIIEGLKELGCRIIEADTDGVFFQAPGRPFGPAEGERLVREVSSRLPESIILELDGSYRAMFSYKMKNYALLEDGGRLVLRGSGLKSRGLEAYLRKYLREMILLALEDRVQEIETLYQSFCGKIMNHKMPIEDLSKKETLTDSVALYQEKVKNRKRNAKAIYELALSSDRSYRPGDQISYYITGKTARVTAYRDCRFLSDWRKADPDENIAYYLAKLDDMDRKFRPLLLGGGL